MWLFDDYIYDILPFDEGSRDSLMSAYYASHKNVVDSIALQKLDNKPYIRNMLTKTCIILLLMTNIEVRVVISCHLGTKGEECVQESRAYSVGSQQFLQSICRSLNWGP
jgi:hypothetical protein